jgi:hypothetical protein
MASDLINYFASDGRVRGRQFYAVTIQLLERGAAPASVSQLLTSVGCQSADKYVNAAQRAIQYKRTREFQGAISADCVTAAAAELGVSLERAFTLHVGEDIRAIPVPKAVVAGRFSRNSLAFVMGEPGVGKTFWMVSLAASITTAQLKWMGKSIHPDLRGGTVIYALAEGAGMFQIRLIGALQHLAHSAFVEIPKAFIFTKESMKLEDTATVERFIKQAEPHRPCMVVVDTYQRHGGPETEEERVSKAIEHLTSIKEELGCTVVGVHHLPKDGRQTPRGHGAIDGSIDTAVYLTKDEQGIVEARFEQRDMEDSTFCAQTKVQMVDGYIDDDTGEPRTTLVLEECAGQRAHRISQTSANAQQKQNQLTAAIIATVTLTPGINQSDLCTSVGGKKATAIAEITRLVGTGQLRNTPTTGKAGRIVNHFELGPVSF